jgi:4-carboxymuconolactone decarboxylase
MQVIRSGEMDAEKGDESQFSGTVWQVVLRRIGPLNEMNIYSVLFEPKARTAWHSHPAGPNPLRDFWEEKNRLS